MENNFKEFKNNPRKISDKQIGDLKHSLETLGDLSGIVVNIPTGEIIGGNQRSKIIDLDKCEILKSKIVTFKEPNQQGTLRQGLIKTPGGNLLNYREVQWDEEQCRIANIAANKMGGDWDFETLKNEFEETDLFLGGFENSEISNIFAELSEELSEQTQSNDNFPDEKKVIKLEYSESEYELVKQQIKMSGESAESILWQALGLSND